AIPAPRAKPDTKSASESRVATNSGGPSEPPIEPTPPAVPGPVVVVNHGAPVKAVALSVDGERLITFSADDKRMRLWDISEASSGPSLVSDSLVKDAHPIEHVSFSPNGRYAMTGAYAALVDRMGARPSSPFEGQTFGLWDLSATA